MNGEPKPISTLNLQCDKYTVYKGVEMGVTVYTFIPESSERDFSGDLMDFIEHLIENGELVESQCLTKVQAGLQIFTGRGEIYSPSYNTDINLRE